MACRRSAASAPGPPTTPNASRALTRICSPIRQPPKRPHLSTPITRRTRELNDMEPPSSPTPAGSSKSINVAPIHLNLCGPMASDLLAAHEAEAQKSHAEALAAANMLDQIEEDLDGMKAKGLSRALALGAAMKVLVKDWYNGSLETAKQSTTIKPTGSTGANDARAPTYTKTAADSTNLKAELLRSLAAAITAVQAIPTGIAIIPRSLQDMKALLAKKNVVAAALTNTQIEKEEH
ncbi:hypothetical protein GX48_05982 [Paracoccidioides brasiliensis]|nr:hypothetical protein GX48_05982 [Paracoccidioides brasiliensis]